MDDIDDTGYFTEMDRQWEIIRHFYNRHPDGHVLLVPAGSILYCTTLYDVDACIIPGLNDAGYTVLLCGYTCIDRPEYTPAASTRV